MGLELMIPSKFSDFNFQVPQGGQLQGGAIPTLQGTHSTSTTGSEPRCFLQEGSPLKGSRSPLFA